MYLFFDTETNGLPKTWAAPINDTDNWPRIIQFAMVLFDEHGTLIDSYLTLVKPDGWKVPEEPFWLEKGYTTSKLEESGLPMIHGLEKFCELMYQSKYLVAHNIAFDRPIVICEMERYKVKYHGRKPGLICTMKGTQHMFGKWPKLIDLHKHLFGVEFDGAHDALEDVFATARCFFELKRRGFIWHT